MPWLIVGNSRFEFNGLSLASAQRLPEFALGAVQIIVDWQGAVAEFSLRTSGSTGTPKTILLRRELIIISARATAAAFGLRPGDTLLCCLATETVAGFMMVMRALVNNCNLVITKPSSAPLEEVPAEQRIDFAAFVPLQLESVIDGGYENLRVLNRMKAILVGGAAVSDGLIDKLQRVHAPVFHTYSMTETYTHVAIRRLNGPFAESLYHPLPGVQLELDERGCLVIIAAVTERKPLVTNDLAELNPDGSFRLLGRWDNVINSGGIKIQPEEVEQAAQRILLAEESSIRHLFAAGLPDERLGQKLVLVLEGKEWIAGEKRRFLEALRERLGPYKSPRELYFVDKILLTSSDKIDRLRTLKHYSI